MVQQSVQERGGEHLVAEAAPFCKTRIAGQQNGPFLIAGVDQLEEGVGLRRGSGAYRRARQYIISRSSPHPILAQQSLLTLLPDTAAFSEYLLGRTSLE